MRIVLASGSPRRRELLEAAGLCFEVIPSSAEEIQDAALGMAGLCEENACLKAAAVCVPGAVVIAADTLVFIEGQPLGKPKDMAEAHEMLRRLSGRTHQVCTGVCVVDGLGEVQSFHAVTDVVFRELDEPGISEYLALTSPLDKAGAYGIQDRGELIVERISGGYDNVMGLPVGLVLEVLEEIGLPIAHR
jgi:septum formation protein